MESYMLINVGLLKNLKINFIYYIEVLIKYIKVNFILI